MKQMLGNLTQNNTWLAIVISLVLFVINITLLPSILNPENLISTLAVLAPLILIAMAATPSILSGGGGIDVSMGPIIAFTNVSLFTIIPYLGVNSPFLIIVLLLLFGVIIGTISGILVTIVRLQPIVATLGVNLVLTGLAKVLMPAPTGTIEPWLHNWAFYFGPIPAPIVVVGIALLLWWIITKLPYYTLLLAVGGDERAAFSSGINITLVRLLAYTLGGFYAALAGIAITAFVGAGDPAIGNSYTMIAIAAAALGGTSLAGGRGGMFGSFFGATAIFFIQKLLNTMEVSNFYFSIIYGGILVLALMANSLLQTYSAKRERI